MKTRSGFVSNSSSSSFVVMGARLRESLNLSLERMIELMDQYHIPHGQIPEDDFWSAIWEGRFGFCMFGECADGHEVVGTLIAEVKEYGDFDESDFTLEDLRAMGELAKKDIKQVLGVDIEPKLILGTRNC